MDYKQQINLSEWESLLIDDLRRANALNLAGDRYNADHYLSCAREAIESLEKLQEGYEDDEREEVTDFVYASPLLPDIKDEPRRH